MIICNGEWEKYCEALHNLLDDIKPDVSYTKLEKIIKEASRKVMKKSSKKPQEKIFGYNKDIQKEIKARRLLCSKWKKEKNMEIKKVLEKEYREQKQKVNDMMDMAEAEEIKKIRETC